MEKEDRTIRLLLLMQRYNFESNSQRQPSVWLQVFVVATDAKIQFWKQFTTWFVFICKIYLLLLLMQRYNFESNSQLSKCRYFGGQSCCYWCKDTILKAIHNLVYSVQKRKIGWNSLYFCAQHKDLFTPSFQGGTGVASTPITYPSVVSETNVL